MNAREAGYLLLTSHLGNPVRKVLTAAQMRTLACAVQQMQIDDPKRTLEISDFVALGYGREMAGRIISLLDENELLKHYISRGERAGCLPVTRVTEGYPGRVRERLGFESPGCLWCKGDLSLLEMPAIALVGSRELSGDNRAFAEEVGRQAAERGYVLVSGNARGADQAAQEACCKAGGKVISVVADELAAQKTREHFLYVSEEEFDAPFSAQRALSRNRVIHSMGQMTFVAQCGERTGGTWDGTTKNLRFGWSPVYCYRDGSPAQRYLEQLGAECITMRQLENFEQLPQAWEKSCNLFQYWEETK